MVHVDRDLLHRVVLVSDRVGGDVLPVGDGAVCLEQPVKGGSAVFQLWCVVDLLLCRCKVVVVEFVVHQPVEGLLVQRGLLTVSAPAHGTGTASGMRAVVESVFFAEFFTEMRPKIVRFIRARLPLDMAEDLASETMLTLWRKDLPPPVGAVALRQRRTLTYMIAVGHIRNLERKLAAEARLAEAVGGATLQIHGSTEDPTFNAIVPDSLAITIASMEQRDQEALHLMIVGFGTGEIADILGISAKAASMRLCRARDRLKTRLQSEEVSHDG